MELYSAIRELPADERPREKLVRYGPERLSAQELLAIVLRTGTRNVSALLLADRLLHCHAGLRGLAGASLADLQRTPGVGAVKAIQIAACFELGKRLMALPEEHRRAITTPEEAAALLSPEMRHLDVEVFRALLLDTKSRLIRIETITKGTLDSSLVHPREVFKCAMAVSAASLVVCHNHPTGDPRPSPDDLKVTRRLRDAGEVVGIELVDHIIIGGSKWVSLKREGLI